MMNLTDLLNSPTRLEWAIQNEYRCRARRNLLNFTKFTYPRYKVDPFHKHLSELLDQAAAGNINKLIVIAPPQHGKSELVSRRLPAYWVGNNPNQPIILTSYGASLAHSMSRRAREIVESSDYKELFPGVHTRADSRAVQHWELFGYQQGGVVSAGCGGPIVGHGAQLGIIDDPFENWAQAQSPTIRNKIWDWYRGTFRTRMWENSITVLIMTRWHEDDLVGRIVSDQPEEWTIARYPAVAEDQDLRNRRNVKLGLPAGLPDPINRLPGEPLAPSRFSKAALSQIERDVGPSVWSAEYQGAPEQREGNRFKRHWFKFVDRVPVDIPNSSRLRYWDLAATEGINAVARTAGVLMAVHMEGTGYNKVYKIYIEDVVVGKWSTDNRNKRMVATAERDHARYNNRGKCRVEQEPGSAGKDAINAIIHYLAGYSVRSDRPTGDKDTRLEPFAGQAEQGNVYLVRGPWNESYISEMTTIPSGLTRDQGDASAGAYNILMGSRVSVGRIE